eukprot:363291-Chlamydomonas_euryale.AAC.13
MAPEVGADLLLGSFPKTLVSPTPVGPEQLRDPPSGPARAPSNPADSYDTPSCAGGLWPRKRLTNYPHTAACMGACMRRREPPPSTAQTGQGDQSFETGSQGWRNPRPECEARASPYTL